MKWWVLILLSFGHLVTDIHQGALPLMLPFLRDYFELSYFAVSAIIFVATFSSSIVQPLFGLYSDRFSIPWMLPAGVAAAATGMALVGVMPSYPLVLLAVFISGMGVASFHPEGSKMAHFAAGTKRGGAMSVFAVGGNFGFGIGPLLAALFLSTWGLSGSLAFLVPGLVTAGFIYFLLPKIMSATSDSRENWQKQRDYNKANNTGKAVFSWGLILLMIIVFIRSWIHFGLATYIPFYYVDYLGGKPEYGAIVLSVFLIAGAIGTLLGGPLADTFGTKKQICGSLVLMIPILYLFINSTGVFSIVMIGLAGLVLISTFATTTVMGQQYMPNNLGLASGLLLGFSIGAGGLGAPLLGILADAHGLPLVMKIISLLPILGLALALFLPPPPEVAEMKHEEAVGPVQKA